MKNLRIAAILLTLVMSNLTRADGIYDGGDGSESNPYQIRTAEQLNTIGLHPEDWNKHFLLTGDPSMAGYTGTDFNRIGSDYDHPFNGVFEGAGHVISNLNWTSNDMSYIGLFGCVGPNGEIKNLHLDNVSISETGYGNYIGGLAGHNQGSIKNCSVTGAVEGNEYVGGLIGYENFGNIINCTSGVTVTGDYRVGGLIGHNYYGDLNNCYATGEVTGSSYVGGLIGQNSYGSALITYCYAGGNVSGNYSVGGLVGENRGDISVCYATGSVTGSGDRIGGLVGYNNYRITNSYATGGVDGVNSVGGLLGYNDYGTVQNSYAAGSITASGIDIGGLAGYTRGDLLASFWDTLTTGQSFGVGYVYSGTIDIYGKTTTEMMQQSTFVAAGWDFGNIWVISEGVDYPRHLIIPDLKVTNAVSTFLSVEANQGFEIPVEIQNIGNGDAVAGGGFVTALYYSSTSSVDWDSLGAEAILAEFNLESLWAGESYSEVMNLVASPEPGYRYLRVRTDNLDDVVEKDETNNWGQVITLYVYQPDSYEPDDSYDQASTISTDGIPQTHSIEPRTDIDWVSFTISQYLSVTIETDGSSNSNTRMWLYASDGITQIAYDDNSGNGNYAKITAALDPGTYYVKVDEYNNDNVITEYSLTVTTSILAPDLAVLNGSSGYISASTGQAVGIPLEIINIGSGAAGGFTTQLYLAENPSVDWEGTDPNLVAELDLAELVAGGSYSSNFTFTAPEEAGIFYLRAKADTSDTVTEINETNNWSVIMILEVDAVYTYGGGAGTEADPYQIRTATQLNAIGAIQSDWNQRFILMADIGLSDYTEKQYNRIGIDTDHPFNGVFEGAGHVISNLNWTSKDMNYIGLFGCVGPNGEIKNLRLDNISISETGYGNYIGGLAGFNQGTVTNCSVTGTVEGNEYVGGLIGCQEYGNIINCTSGVTVTGDYSVGGLIGYNNYGNLNNCYATGEVTGYGYVGGLIGQNSYGSALITYCYAGGNVSGNYNVGGLVGDNRGDISVCYATGSVTGSGDRIGGLAGYNNYRITNSYATGGVDGVNSVGGLLGYNDYGTVQNCYAAGSVTASGIDIGGLAGYTRGDLLASFWDTLTTGQSFGVGYVYSGTIDIYGKTTAEMMQQNTFAAAGWDFADIWMIDEGVDYPRHLIAPDLAVSAAPSTFIFVEANQGFAIPVEIQNIGNGDASAGGGFVTALYYSSTSSVDWDSLGAEAILAEFNLGSLKTGASYSEAMNLTASAETGYSYLRVRTDNLDDVAEKNETNNWGQVITLYTYQGDAYEPDDSYDQASVIATDGTPQTHSIDPWTDVDWISFTLTEYSGVTIETDGPGNDDTYLSLYEGDGTTFIVSDDSSGNGNYSKIMIPLEAGTYYVKVEEHYNNQTIEDYSITVSASLYAPELFVSSISSSYIAGSVAQTIDVPVQLENTGFMDAGSFTTQLYLSENPAIDWETLEPNAVVAETVSSGLSAGASGSVILSFTAPAEAGIYYLRAKVDGYDTVSEIDEENNWSVVIILALDAAYAYGGGAGTEEDPYQIRTAIQMNAIGAIQSDWNAHFALQADIDLSEYTGTMYNRIGNESNYFYGTFDGLNHTISHFNWSSSGVSYVGLFGRLGSNGEVKNLILDEVQVEESGSGDYIGSLAGYNNYGAISNCSAMGTVMGDDNIGGLVGLNDHGTISNCSAAGTVTGDYYIGGLIGNNNYYGNIIRCTTNSDVTGNYNVGGLTGYNYYGTINSCMSEGTVVGLGDVGGLVGLHQYSNAILTNCIAHAEVSGGYNVGGLAGENRGDIRVCYATGSVTGSSDNIGGLVGYNSYNITDSYALGNVDGINSVGGLLGYNNYGTVQNCYAVGRVAALGQYFGGLVGYNQGNLNALFWDTLTTEQESGVGYLDSGTIDIYGKTTAEMMQQGTFTAAGWDFQGTWIIDEGVDYPHHRLAPDLVVANAAVISIGVQEGQSVDIPIQIQNIGNADAAAGGGFITALYMADSLPPDWDQISEPNIAGQFSVDLLPLGSSYTETINITAPPAPESGFYYLRCKTDNTDAVAEKNESNNWGEVITLIYPSTYGGGSGALGDPYQIRTAEHLYTLSASPTDWNKHFLLMNDIDMSGYDGQEGRPAFIPIGDQDSENPFSATFDGNHQVVRNLTINADSEENVAMFSFINDGAEIKNLGLEAVNIVATDCYVVGGLVGWCGWDHREGFIADCYVSGSIRMSGGYIVGGLVARVNKVSEVQRCYSDVNIVISDSSWSEQIGGFVGSSKGTISDCYGTGSVTVSNNTYQVGGFIGYNGGNVMACYASSTVAAGEDCGSVGGFAGHNGYCDGALMENCFATGDVSVGDYAYEVGGLIGRLGNGDTINCYSVGHVASGVDSEYVGGLVGYNCSGSIEASFWDIETSGQTVSDGGQGLPTAAMKLKSTFASAGWTFATDIPGGIWAMADGICYPQLAALYTYSGGKGTIEDPYRISHVVDLLMSGARPNCHYKMMNNIDMAGIIRSKSVLGHFPDSPFTGIFDGNGHVIRNFTLMGGVPDESGFFGYVDAPNAVIKNLGLEEVVIEAFVSWDIGGLVGYINEGQIINCYVQGAIYGSSNFVGGLVGYNGFGVITDCYAIGMVEGMWYVGGLVGMNWDGAISTSYAAVDIWGAMSAGGLIGFDKNGTYKACFWDTDVAGVGTGIGNGDLMEVTGKTTSELMQQTTFTDAGWDFVGESANGTEDIWRLVTQGVTYPQLFWQKDIPGDFVGTYGVDLADYAVFAAAWLSSEGDAAWNPDCDMVQDKSIDILDLWAFTDNWLNGIH